MYSWIALYLAAQGPGAWALDNLRHARAAAGERPDEERPSLRAA